MEWLLRLMGLLSVPPPSLEEAVLAGDASKVREVLRAGAGNVDYDEFQHLARRALGRDDLEVLRVLVEAGAGIDDLLRTVVSEGYADVIPFFPTTTMETATGRLSRWNRHQRLGDDPTSVLMPRAEALLDSGADSNTNAEGVTALMAAANMGGESLVGLLLSRGANPNQVAAHSGYTALFYAAMSNQPGVVRHLLDASSDPDVLADDGTSAADVSRVFYGASGHEVRVMLGTDEPPPEHPPALSPVSLADLDEQALDISIEVRGPGLAGKHTTLEALVAHFASVSRESVRFRDEFDESRRDVGLTLGARLADGRTARIVAGGPTGPLCDVLLRDIPTGTHGVLLLVDSQLARAEASKESTDATAKSLHAHGPGRVPVAILCTKRDGPSLSSEAIDYARATFARSKVFLGVPCRGQGVVEPFEWLVSRIAEGL